MPPTDEVWDQAVAEMAAAQRIGVVGHVRPDGDALGSMIALSLGARSVGKDVVASFGLPFVVGDEFRMLDQSVLVHPSEFPDDLDLAIICDTGVLDRIGSVGADVSNAKRVLVIDHHHRRRAGGRSCCGGHNPIGLRVPSAPRMGDHPTDR